MNLSYVNTPVPAPVDMAARRTLMGLVKSDNHKGVELFLRNRDDADQLLNSKPDGCLMLNEATSARMRALLLDCGAEADAVDAAEAVPNAHKAWAMSAHGAL